MRCTTQSPLSMIWLVVRIPAPIGCYFEPGFIHMNKQRRVVTGQTHCTAWPARASTSRISYTLDGVYNHLNIMLLGVLQLLYNMMAGASAGNDGRSGRRATTRLCFDGRGCRRADREPARARRTSEWHQGLMHYAYWLKLFEAVRAFVVSCARAFR